MVDYGARLDILSGCLAATTSSLLQQNWASIGGYESLIKPSPLSHGDAPAVLASIMVELVQRDRQPPPDEVKNHTYSICWADLHSAA